MQLAVCRLAALEIEVRHVNAKGMQTTTFVIDVYHSVPSMLLAVGRILAALDVEARPLIAKGMCATTAKDVYHSVPSMLLAVCRLHALDIEARAPRARVM